MLTIFNLDKELKTNNKLKMRPLESKTKHSTEPEKLGESKNGHTSRDMMVGLETQVAIEATQFFAPCAIWPSSPHLWQVLGWLG